MYLGPPWYGYAINCHLVYLAIPGTRPLCTKKQNVFQKVKFKYVLINMKQVSYTTSYDSLRSVTCRAWIPAFAFGAKP